MSEKLRILFISSLFFAIVLMLNTSAKASETYYCFDSYYAGVDLQGRSMPFKKNFGSHAFNHSLSQSLNIFTGIKVNDYFGVEAGYEFSDTDCDKRVMPSQSIVFGAPIEPHYNPANSITNIVDTKSKLEGFNINLVGFLPIPIENHKVSFIGSIGLSTLKSKTYCRVTETLERAIVLHDPFEYFTMQKVSNSESRYKKWSTGLRVSTGIQYINSHPFGIRALITWENTHKIKIKGVDRYTKNPVMEYARFKDSLIYRVGFFLPF